jgi:hypothetical protein
VGALSLAVTVGSSTAGLASLVMNIVLLLSVVVSGALGDRCRCSMLPRPFGAGSCTNGACAPEPPLLLPGPSALSGTAASWLFVHAC